MADKTRKNIKSQKWSEEPCLKSLEWAGLSDSFRFLSAASIFPDSSFWKFFAVGGRILMSLVPTFTVSLNSDGTATVAISFQLIDFPHPNCGLELLSDFTVLWLTLVMERRPLSSHLNEKVPSSAYAGSLTSLTLVGRFPQVVTPSQPSTLVQMIPQWGHLRNSDTPCSLWYPIHSVLIS